MQHNVTDTVLNALSGAHAGVRWRSPLGFSVVALHTDPVDGVLATASTLSPGRLRGGADAATLLWREDSPPYPGRLRALNPGAESIVVEVGGGVDGGMSMRVVQATTVIPARAEVTVAVEVLGARWWSHGQLVWRGPLDPVVTALVFQSVLGAAAVAASARTAAWSLPEPEIFSAADLFPSDATAGWLLVDHGAVVAGRAPRTQAIASAGEWSEWRAIAAAEDGESIALHASLRSGIDSGVLRAHTVGRGRRAGDLIVLPRDFRLVDGVVAASSRHRV